MLLYNATRDKIHLINPFMKTIHFFIFFCFLLSLNLSCNDANDGSEESLAIEFELFDSIKSKDSNRLALAIKNGASVNGPLELLPEYSPLMLAASVGCSECSRILLESGSNVNYENSLNQTPLIVASYNGYLEIVKMLIDSGANFSKSKIWGMNSLLKASSQGHYDVTKYLIECGIDVNSKNNNGSTSLILAAEKSHNSIAKLLLNQGANINLRDDFGETALMKAAQNGNIEILQLLIKNGADTELKNKHGKTALGFAKHFKYDKAVKILSGTPGN